jgi:hypothetical protein
MRREHLTGECKKRRGVNKLVAWFNIPSVAVHVISNQLHAPRPEGCLILTMNDKMF